MRLTYIAEAREELLEAVAWYEDCQTGLGRRFDKEIQAAEDAILRHPAAWTSLGGGFRRILLQRFPYSVIFHQPAADWIEVVVVMHQHREPDIWRSRAG